MKNKMKINHIKQRTRNRKSIFLLFAAIIACALVSSCDEDKPDDIGGTDVAFGITYKNSGGIEMDSLLPADYICSFPQQGGSLYFYVE